MGTFVYNKTLFATTSKAVSNCGTKESGTDNKIIKFHDILDI